MLVHYKALTPVYFHFLISLKNKFDFSCLVINLLHIMLIVVFMSVFHKIVTELKEKKSSILAIYLYGNICVCLCISFCCVYFL